MYSFDQAFERSYLTLVAFNGPDEEKDPGVRSLIRWELACAVLLVILIFSMLINRISAF